MTVAHQVTEFANWLDNFFGDERIYNESQNSSLKLNLLQINEEGHQPRYEANLQGKLTLPNTQKRLELLFESDPEKCKCRQYRRRSCGSTGAIPRSAVHPALHRLVTCQY